MRKRKTNNGQIAFATGVSPNEETRIGKDCWRQICEALFLTLGRRLVGENRGKHLLFVLFVGLFETAAGCS